MSHLSGKFVWFEVMTHDIDKAKAFYTQMFGWEVEEMSMEGGFVYSAFRNGGANFGGLFPMDKSMKDVPPHWLGYLSVDDVDETAKKIESAEGMIAVEPMTVPGVGRMALALDPEGARFSVFAGQQPDPPDDQDTEIGGICWCELWSNLADAALKFYCGVFGYDFEEFPTEGEGKYYVLKTGDKTRAGIMQSRTPGVPSNWVQYVSVENCDNAADKARSLGGKVLFDPVEMRGVGRFTVIEDPEGAVIGIIQQT
ncbi:MAG: VOC family protein [Deltaproteobacteria bacterium]|nr:VOC family protein [Deltaproteobacteria bacterium]